MSRLEGKVAVVTGAAQGMGEEHARQFVAEGAKVVLTDINVGPGSALATELGDHALFVEHDVSQASGWTEVVEQARTHFGPVTVLVNNAGVLGELGKPHEVSQEAFEQVCSVHLLGTFLGIKAVIPEMLAAGSGSIINVSSVLGMAALPGGNIAYVASKFAVRGMAKQVAVEYGPNNIRCNSIHPGYIDTPMMRAATESGYDGTPFIPLRRYASTSEVSDLVVFLASDQSSYITGMEHVIDGGLTAYSPFAPE